MKKHVFALAAALLTGAASAATPITLNFDSPTTLSGSFAASATGSNTFLLDLSFLSGSYTNIQMLSSINAGFTGGSGYDVTSVTIDGNPYTPVVNFSSPGFFGADLWVGTAALSAAAHTIVVTGNWIGGDVPVGFTGSLSLTAQPVPEPESYALMLAGLAAIGGLVRRRGLSR
jgi:PEP-CTERM motif